MADGAPWWPSLDQAMLRDAAKRDVVMCLLAGVVHLVVAARAASAAERAIELLPVALEAGLIWCTFAVPRARSARVRPPLVVAIRLCILLLIPFGVDLLEYSKSGGGLGDGSGRRAHLKALLMLLMPVSMLHACFGACAGIQLPPLQHAIVHFTSMAVLLRRAPKVCRQYVAVSPATGRVVGVTYKLLQELLSALCLGSRAHLAAAAEASSPCQQCVAVVWALQVSLGVVLPTLMVWRAQYQAASTWAAEQRAREQPRQRRRHLQHYGGGPLPMPMLTVAEMEFAASQYATVAAPVLQRAAAFPGGWQAVAPLSALVAWLAAVLLRSRWDAPCSAS